MAICTTGFDLDTILRTIQFTPETNNIGVWMINYIRINVIIHPCLEFHGVSAKPT